MSRRHAARLPLLLVLLLVLAACGPDGEEAADAQAQERIAQLEDELERSRDRVETLEQENQALEDELAALEDADPEGDPDGADPAEEPPASTDPFEDVADIRTAEGLIDQLRVHLRDPELEAEMPEGWEPGMTDWTPFEAPEGVAGTYDTPGEVMAALAAEVDVALLGQDQWETTIRVLLDEDDPDLAYGAVLGWGFKDDSVVGRDIRMTLTRTDDDRWEPGGAEQRQHCMRGVTEDGTACI